jgi:hypothetical protein
MPDDALDLDTFGQRIKDRYPDSDYVKIDNATLAQRFLEKYPVYHLSVRSPLHDYVSQQADAIGVDPRLALGLVYQESKFKPRAKSPVGAQGLMQLMPDTAARFGVKDSYDITQAVPAGLRYLKQHLDEFKDPGVALAAYNAGEGAVRKYKGIPPFKETQNYVSSILGLLQDNEPQETPTRTVWGVPVSTSSVPPVPEEAAPAASPAKQNYDVKNFANDLQWHLGMSPQRFKLLSIEDQRKALRAVQKDVDRDNRYRDIGVSISEPSVEDKQALRKKLGLPIDPPGFDLAIQGKNPNPFSEVDARNIVANAQGLVKAPRRANKSFGQQSSIIPGSTTVPMPSGDSLAARQALRSQAVSDVLQAERARQGVISRDPTERPAPMSPSEREYAIQQRMAQIQQARAEPFNPDPLAEGIAGGMKMAQGMAPFNPALPVSPVEARTVPEGAIGAVGSTIRQVANAADAAARYLPTPMPVLRRLMPGMAAQQDAAIEAARNAGKRLQAGAQLSEADNPPTGLADELRQGIGRGVGNMAVELPKLILGGQYLGAANLPIQGALSREEEGLPGIIKGAAGGIVYHYGMGVTGPALSRIGNALFWTALPAAESHFMQGTPWGKAIGESLPMGALAFPAGGHEPVQIRDAKGETRAATVDDLKDIADKKVDVVQPTIQPRFTEPGDARFGALNDSQLQDRIDLLSQRPKKGTSKARRAQIPAELAAAQSELARRQQDASTVPQSPYGGSEIPESTVPTFQDFVENHQPQGGVAFDSLSPTEPLFQQRLKEYVEKYGTKQNAAPETPVARITLSPEVKKEATPPAAPAQGEQGPVIGFTTARGSTYTVNGESTQRNKSFHPEHDPRDVGLKPASRRTVYVDPEDAREIGMHNTLGKESKPSVKLTPEGIVLTITAARMLKVRPSSTRSRQQFLTPRLRK